MKDEVTELARKYSIVTPYTAYLIVEDEARRGVPLLSQTMPQLQQDTKARDASGAYYNRLMRERNGLGPVTRSRSELALKSATIRPLGAPRRSSLLPASKWPPSKSMMLAT